MAPDGLCFASVSDDGGARLWSLQTPAARPVPQAPEPFSTVTWQGNGRLQAAPALTGPWTDQPFAASPARIAPSQRSQFFRLILQ